MTRMLILLAALAVLPAVASATALSLCVFDPSGANGDAFQYMKDYQVAAAAWGVKWELRPYTDEKTAAEDFKAGQCDAALLTGVRGRPFQKFSSSIEAYGALPSYDLLKKVIVNLANPGAAKLMRAGDYEAVGIFPAGAVYLFTNDRAINTVEALAGKRLATLDYDAAAKMMVEHVGASMVSAELATFSGMFNNANVDVCYSTAVGYKALELYRGIGKKGGVVRYPLAQLTFQIIARADKLPAGYGVESRKWGASNFDRFLKIVERSEAEIPKDQWIDISSENRVRYDKMFQEARIEVRDKLGSFDKTMLRLMRRVRCSADATRAECTEKKE